MSTIGRRVIITGSTGSGKSTLAEALAERLGLPFVELDALFWTHPDWVEPEDEAFRERVRVATAGDTWVVAGNYFGRTQDLTWPRADTIVFLDYPLPLILMRIVRRSWIRWRSRELLWGIQYESFWRHFTTWNDSLIVWAFRSHGKLKARWREVSADPVFGHVHFVRLRSQQETDRWLAAVAPEVVERRPASA
jgi:adenylate kinase family enzyme